MQKITPFLWFNNHAEPAVKFYTSIFKKSKITAITHYDDVVSKAAGRPKGSVMTIEFELNGEPFIALNGGSMFKFSEAISFYIDCKTQAEVDHFWNKLSQGGKKLPCGWLTDKFGIAWQVVPTILTKAIKDKNPQRSQRVMAAMLKMSKLDVAKLERAYKGK
jgi:predicted 3-demethylubiquinone-9 3-methyltransferase (glyoxalase superfamily)